MKKYDDILPVLVRMLGCGEPGSGPVYGWEQPCAHGMAYLGEAEIYLCEEVRIATLTSDPDWQEHLRHAATLADAYNGSLRWMYSESIKFDCDIDVEVEIPTDKLSADDLALHQLRIILVNNHEWGDGEGHDWARDVGQELANTYAEKKESILGTEWNMCDWEDGAWAPLINYLAALGLNPTTLGFARRVWDAAELPETAALKWVQDHNIVQRLFPAVRDTYGDIAKGVAFCLDGLAEDRPEGDVELLYLNDLYAKDYDEARAGLIERISALPAIAEFAQRLASSSSGEVDITIMRELYAEAPNRGVWVVG
jgi:hypothetical protein